MTSVADCDADTRPFVRLAKINALSFLAQTVQIGTVPPLIALRLSAAGESLTVVGAVAAAPWVAILLAGRFVPRLLARYGIVAGNWIALGLSFCAVAGMCVTRSPSIVFVLNVFFGLGLIVRWVACDTWIVAIAPHAVRGRAIGTHETLMGCGIAVGPLLIALTGAVGTVPLVVCLGLLAGAAAMLFFLTTADVFPEPPARQESAGHILGLAVAIAAGAVAGLAETSSVSFLPIIADARHFSLGSTAVLTGFGIGGTLLQVPIGWLADRIGYRRAQLLSALVVLGGAAAFPLVASNALSLWGVLFLWGGAIGGMNTLAVIEAGHRATAGTSTMMMAIAMAYTVGSIIGPLAAGVATWAFPAFGLSLVACVACAVFLILWLLLAPRAQRAAATNIQEAPNAYR